MFVISWVWRPPGIRYFSRCDLVWKKMNGDRSLSILSIRRFVRLSALEQQHEMRFSGGQPLGIQPKPPPSPLAQPAPTLSYGFPPPHQQKPSPRQTVPY